jgi:hypothetical protein
MPHDAVGQDINGWRRRCKAPRRVAIVEEGARAAIAALGHVARMTGDGDTGEAGHAA